MDVQIGSLGGLECLRAAEGREAKGKGLGLVS